MGRPVRRFGSDLADSIWPARRDEWLEGMGFEFCPDGALKVYSFTNPTLTRGRPGKPFALTARGNYTLMSGVLEVRVNDEIASIPFPPTPPTFPGIKLPEHLRSKVEGAIFLPLTNYLTVGNQVTAGGTVNLKKVTKFMFE
jgi:hypothetical protein